MSDTSPNKIAPYGATRDAERGAPWGKFDAQAGTRHHLAHHCADVAACFLELAKGSVIRARMERAAGRVLSEADVQRLAVLVFLHDAGKLHPGFQAKGWPEGVWRGPLFGHVQEGAEIFLASNSGQMLSAAGHLRVDALIAWGVDEGLLRAVISHHGRPASTQLRSLAAVRHYWKPYAGYDPDAAAAAIGALLPRWYTLAFAEVSKPLPNKPAFDHLMCGLTALADWIGSDTRWFGHHGELDGGYIAHAADAARRACREIGIDVSAQRAALTVTPSFAAISAHATPNPQQALVGTTDLDEQLVILEAETGSGKTEAALWRYARLFEAGRVDGLYFAVPTRAAAVQLHDRVCKAAARLFGQAAPAPVLAVPGYLKAGEVEGSALPHWRVLWDDDQSSSREDFNARWAAEHPKRYLAAPIAVGTVDQAMLGALQVKHAHLRAGSMSRSLLVIDEVHASDRYMAVIQKRLLDAHMALGGHAMLMSATLGSVARDQWLGARTETPFEAAVETPYPAVWTRSGAAFGESTQPTRAKHVGMELLDTMSPEATAQRSLQAARAGARVLVIRNTVARAIETLAALEAISAPGDTALFFTVDGTSTLHHSRFAPSDRKLLDAAVEQALSTSKDRPREGRIVIGTQTLEQSLDIDADMLLTDLCPADVLLQRIGRLHRHSLARPASFEQSRCVVMVPEKGLAALLAPQFENGLGAWRSGGGLHGVYRDLAILELTRRFVHSQPVWSIPAMNRQIVEGATHPHCIEALLEELGGDWRRYHDEVIGSQSADAVFARGFLIDRTQPFEQLAYPADGEERIRTRLGEEGAKVQIAEPHPIGPFGKDVSEFVLPAHWTRGLVVDEEPIACAADGSALLFSVGGRNFRYDRCGLSKAGGDDAEPAD